jgi:hypothetical protein
MSIAAENRGLYKLGINLVFDAQFLVKLAEHDQNQLFAVTYLPFAQIWREIPDGVTLWA